MKYDQAAKKLQILKEQTHRLGDKQLEKEEDQLATESYVMHAKLLLVVLMTAYHGIMVGKAKKMARGDRPLSEKQLRMWGEVPGILLALIVVLVVVKPF